ncbi:hypothetical protein BpHYR1_029667 [Brachionus plicatilis]|uniref:Uncharacterized protein n=1 Tax=Brachionus plicatilis TaxID=10195 RepID=A0A3M7QXK5_BRAPC|nr:hypothetical protein BpHYR1_029667 [Brachionus plicatilis]
MSSKMRYGLGYLKRAYHFSQMDYYDLNKSRANLFYTFLIKIKIILPPTDLFLILAAEIPIFLVNIFLIFLIFVFYRKNQSINKKSMSLFIIKFENFLYNNFFTLLNKITCFKI